MTRTRVWLLLSLIAVAGALLALGIAISHGSTTPSEPATATRTASPARGTASAAKPVLAVNPPAGENELPTDDRAAVAESTRVEASQNFELAEALWVQGTMRFSHGVPADERVELYAFSSGSDDAGFADECARISAQSLRTDLGAQSQPVARVLVDANGGFRAPFAKGSVAGCLRICARYSYLLVPHALVLPSDDEVVLEPKLGAWLTGRFTLPDVRPPDFDPHALAFEVEISGWRSGGGRAQSQTFALDGALDFELGGLAPDFTYFLLADPVQFVAAQELTLHGAAGEHVERVFALLAGASVSGQVVDEQRRPLAGVRVTHAGSGGFGAWNPGRARSAETADDGTFTLRALRPGKCQLSAELEGRLPATSEELELQDGDARTGIAIRLEAGNRLSGRVLWPDARPAALASVTVVESVEARAGGGARGRWQREEEHSTSTDAAGAFAVSGLGAGPFEVRAECSESPAGPKPATADGGSSDDDDEGPLWRARAEQVGLGVELVLKLEAPLEARGRVVDDLGAPVPHFSIAAAEVRAVGIGASRNFKTLEFDDEGGAFTYPNLSAGRWTLSAEAEAHGRSEAIEVVLPGASELLLFTVPRSSALAGVVRDPFGAAASGARVQARRSGGSRWSREQEETTCDAEGRFSFAALAPGSIELMASADEFAPSERTSLELVAGGSQSDVELALREGGRLTGEIYNSAGAPDPGRSVRVQDFGGGGGSQATSDAAGTFAIEHLAPGNYQVFAMPDAAALGGSSDPSTILSQLKMASVDIKDRETTHVVLGAPPKAPVRLHGHVTEAGTPVSGGVVMAVVEGGAVLNSMKMDATDAAGEYVIVLDAPGEYTLFASQSQDVGQGCELHASVPEAEELVLDIALPVGAIAGRVVGPDGTPAAGVPLAVESEDRASMFAMGGGRGTTSGADGSFAFRTLQAGRYTLRAGANRFGGFGSETPRFGTAVRTGLVVRDDAPLEGLEIRLSAPCSIQGSVRDSSGKAAPDASVFVRDEEGRVLNPLSSCTSDATGHFTFAGAAAGTYTLCARLGNQASLESAPVRADSGTKTDVALTLEPGTILRVTIEGKDKRPVSARVSVQDEHGREVGGMLEGAAMQRFFSEGFVPSEQKIGPLPPGKYRVSASDAGGARDTKSVSLGGQEERKLTLRLGD